MWLVGEVLPPTQHGYQLYRGGFWLVDEVTPPTQHGYRLYRGGW